MNLNYKLVCFATLLILFITSCDKTESFADLQDKENEIIDNYIKDNGIKLVYEMPDGGEWDETTYYKSPTGIYYHLVSNGDTATQVELRSKVSYRYIAYNLKNKSTVSYWEPGILPIPFSILYDPTNMADIASGIFEALGYMKHRGSVAKVIVPSANNTTDYSAYVVPVVYDLKITSID